MKLAVIIPYFFTTIIYILFCFCQEFFPFISRGFCQDGYCHGRNWLLPAVGNNLPTRDYYCFKHFSVCKVSEMWIWGAMQAWGYELTFECFLEMLLQMLLPCHSNLPYACLITSHILFMGFMASPICVFVLIDCIIEHKRKLNM